MERSTMRQRRTLALFLVAVTTAAGSACSSESKSNPQPTQQAAAPDFHPPGGSYSSPQSVELTSGAGASIRYTLDGTKPSSTSGTLYSGPISVSADTTVKAIAYGAGLNDSQVVTASYVITATAPAKVAAPTFSPQAGEYTTSVSVTLATPTTDASIRYTVDGSTPSKTSGLLYSTGTPIVVTSTTTIRAIAYADGKADSAVSQAIYTIIPPGQVAAPSFDPPAGAYTTTLNVALTSSTGGVSIRYTTDGSAPSPSAGTAYDGPIPVGASLTIKAIAYKDGLNDSTVSSASYVIDLPAPTATAEPGTQSFSGATLSVTLHASNPASGTYHVDSGAETNYTDGQDIVIDGTTLAPGQSRTLVVKNGTATHTYVYTKAAPNAVPATLGALYTSTATTFRIWSPDSAAVTVKVGGTIYPCAPVPDFNGYSHVYEATVQGDLKNQAYQFAIGGTNVRDPYAMMASPTVTEGKEGTSTQGFPGTTEDVVVDMADIQPTRGTWAPRPALTNREDAIIYEVHVRDFTIDASSGVDEAKRGKFMGMVQTGTTIPNTTTKTGIDHLKELGITHVQLMPVFDYGTVAYNWGYDPVNYDVPEEKYSQATAPEDRIREFKDMVDEFHRNGIRVIMDVVYNHTYAHAVLAGITGQYYSPDNLAGTGVGTAIDGNVPMVSRMIRDSLEHWVKDYNVDGFRFDLIGCFNYSDVQSWADYLNSTYSDRTLLMYGEPWNGFFTDPNWQQRVRMGTVAKIADSHVGVFSGQYREAIKGGNDDATKNYIFAQPVHQDGGAYWWGSIAVGSRGSIRASKGTSTLTEYDSMFANDPEQSINYISAHDNLDLWDKINFAGVTDGGGGYAGRIDRFGMGIVLTSQGIPFIHAGDEFLRSKAPNGIQTDIGIAKNSYKADDIYNAIHWGDLVTNSAVNKYYEDAIALRKATPAMRLTTWDAVNTQVQTRMNADTHSGDVGGIHVTQDGTLPAYNAIVSYLSSSASPVSYDTVVVYNSGGNINVTLPAGSWTKVFDTTGAVSKTDTTCEGTAVTVFKKN
jgi:pullulanase